MSATRSNVTQFLDERCAKARSGFGLVASFSHSSTAVQGICCAVLEDLRYTAWPAI